MQPNSSDPRPQRKFERPFRMELGICGNTRSLIGLPRDKLHKYRDKSEPRSFRSDFDEALVENPGEIGTVERYHEPLIASYFKFRMDLCKGTSHAECLQLAVFAVSDQMGPDGVCPILLVYGVLPRQARKSPSPTQLQVPKSIELGMI